MNSPWVRVEKLGAGASHCGDGSLAWLQGATGAAVQSRGPTAAPGAGS
jgi:hypothetical protein